MSSDTKNKEPNKKGKKFLKRNKRINVGKWNKSLKNSDVNQIWTELHRIVSSHPLVRSSKKAGFLVEEGRYNVYSDMTQELFVALLSKERFQHYIDTGMSDQEIEAEISQIELTNLLTAQLRKRHPESYRLARRISTLIQTSDTFKRFDNTGSPEIHRRLAERVFGLSDWGEGKKTRSQGELDERVTKVAFHERDTRMVGCTGDAQIVISNAELEKLIVRVFKAVDSPVNIRAIRGLVMSRLPVMDIYLVPITAPTNSDDDRYTDLDPEPRQGRTVWFGFPLYFMHDDQAQEAHAFIRKVLESPTGDPGALANRLADHRYREMAQAFGFADPGGPRIRTKAAVEKIVGRWWQEEFEAAPGTSDPQMRIALNARTEITRIAGQPGTADGRWFAILGSAPLETRCGLSLGEGGRFPLVENFGF